MVLFFVHGLSIRFPQLIQLGGNAFWRASIAALTVIALIIGFLGILIIGQPAGWQIVFPLLMAAAALLTESFGSRSQGRVG
jgi:hypothetical protein